MDIGFPLEGCKKAVFHTKNAGVEAAMNWVMEHMEDPGLFLLSLLSLFSLSLGDNTK